MGRAVWHAASDVSSGECAAAAGTSSGLVSALRDQTGASVATQKNPAIAGRRAAALFFGLCAGAADHRDPEPRRHHPRPVSANQQAAGSHGPTKIGLHEPSVRVLAKTGRAISPLIAGNDLPVEAGSS